MSLDISLTDKQEVFVVISGDRDWEQIVAIFDNREQATECLDKTHSDKLKVIRDYGFSDEAYELMIKHEHTRVATHVINEWPGE